MSSKVRNEILGRAITDSAFRELLITQPKKALADYELTDRGRESFEGLTAELVGRLIEELPGRIAQVEPGDIMRMLNDP